MLSLKDYCNQTRRKLSEISHIYIHPSTKKLDTLLNCVVYYYENKLITYETYQIISDSRFSRLFSLQISELKRMIEKSNNTWDKNDTSKSSLVIICYNLNLDIDDIAVINNSNNNNSDNDNVDDEEDSSFDIIKGINKFIKKNGKIYLSTSSGNIEITKCMIHDLIDLII